MPQVRLTSLQFLGRRSGSFGLARRICCRHFDLFGSHVDEEAAAIKKQAPVEDVQLIAVNMFTRHKIGEGAAVKEF